MRKDECVEIFERYIQNRASPQEVKRLCLWIKNNKEILLWLEQQILTSSSIIDNEVQMRMLKNIEAKIFSNKEENKASIKQINIRFRFDKLIRVAALFILPVLTAAGVYLYMSKTENSTAPLIIAVDRGQKASITLPDGSKAWLNSQSKLTYKKDFNVKKRELYLDGEAYFEVAKNRNKPFIVKSNDISVEALGTAFSVKAYNEDYIVSSILMSGKVKVTTQDGESILLPNEKIVYDKSTHKTTQSKVTNATDYSGWIHNKYKFEDASLSEIAKTIQRIYNVELIFTSDKLKNLHYTGTINNNSLESVLNIICITSPVSFKINNQQVFLYEK